MPEEADAAAGTKTKRQRLKEADEGKNVWPQFPKLQGAERRDRAHLRSAGLGQYRKKQSDPDLFQHLGRALGGPDAVTRHTAVLHLEQYLLKRCETAGLSEMDLLKLSKCLWYTLYMADRQVVQMELSKIIAKLVVEILAGSEEEDEYAAALYLRACEEEEDDDDLPIEEPDDEEVDFVAKQMELLENDDAIEDDERDEDDDDEEEGSDEGSDKEEDAEENVDEDLDRFGDHGEQEQDDEEEEDPMNTPHGRGAHLSALFFRTFMRTILQNWAQMDKYRIDKFYTMLRFILERVFSYCASRGWNMGMVRLFNDALCDEVLAKLPNGVRCHLIDVCLDELVKHEQDVTEAVFLDVVQPYFSMAQTGVTGDDLVHSRAVENVLERFLDKYSIFSERSDEEDDSPRFHQVHVGTVAQFIFELASDDATLQRYRPRLYDVYKKYMKRINEMGEENDVDISHQDLSIDDDDDDDDGHDEAKIDGREDDIDSNPVVEVLEAESKSNVSKDHGEIKDAPEEKKKKKRKKKRKKKTPDQEDKELSDDKDVIKPLSDAKEKKLDIESQIREKVKELEEENDIVITIAEQQKAKTTMKERKQKASSKKRQREDEKQETGHEKKVKFGEKNFAKSHKASMKALRQASPPAGIRPDRGILLNKDAKIALRKPKGNKNRRK